jgi:hypothetical protein
MASTVSFFFSEDGGLTIHEQPQLPQQDILISLLFVSVWLG